MSRLQELIDQEVAELASKAVDAFKDQLRTAIGAERSIESLEELFTRCRTELHQARDEKHRLQSFANGVASALQMPYETTLHQRLARLVEVADELAALKAVKP